MGRKKEGGPRGGDWARGWRGGWRVLSRDRWLGKGNEAEISVRAPQPSWLVSSRQNPPTPEPGPCAPPAVWWDGLLSASIAQSPGSDRAETPSRDSQVSPPGIKQSGTVLRCINATRRTAPEVGHGFFKKKKRKKKGRRYEERKCWGTEGFKYSEGEAVRQMKGGTTEALMQAEVNVGEQFGTTDLVTFRYLSKSKSACRGQGCINIKLRISIHCHFIVL